MTVMKDEMRQRFRRLFGITVSAAVFAALFCGCAAGGPRNAAATETPREETGVVETTKSSREETGAAAMGPVLPDRIGINTDGDYPYNAEEIMYLSGVRLTAYRENIKYSLCDLDGDGLSELLITVGEGAAEITGIYAYDADQNAAVLEKTYRDGAEDSTLPAELVWVEGTRWPDASLIGEAEQLGDPGVRTDYYLSEN